MNYYIAWWNVENLFDINNAPNRPAWLQSKLNSELNGWTQSVLDLKLNQLGKVIKYMNNNAGPDILGVCEVENLSVLTQLVDELVSLGRNYQIVHENSPDQRGIDIAFIYDADKFSVHNQFSFMVRKRTGTRDIFQVNFKTVDQRDLILIGNHWPARSAGVYESEPYRIIAAETLSYWNERILEIKGSNTAIVVMGDFNDEPFSRSMTDYGLSSNQATKVKNAQTPKLLNLSTGFLANGEGSYYYSYYALMFDQFLVSKGIVKGNYGFELPSGPGGNYVTEIVQYPDHVSGGTYPDPIKFGRPSSGYNPDGYSDHYPVAMILTES